MAVLFSLMMSGKILPKLTLYTDASGALGFGTIFGTRWCYGKWSPDWAYRNIAILEFYPIVLSLYLF